MADIKQETIKLAEQAAKALADSATNAITTALELFGKYNADPKHQDSVSWSEQAEEHASKAQELAEQSHEKQQEALGLSKDVLSGLETLQAETQSAVTTAEAELGNATTAHEQAQQGLQEATESLTKASDELDASTTNLASAKTGETKAQANLNNAKAKLDTSKGELKTAKTEESQAKKELDTAKTEKSAAEVDVAQKKSGQATAKTELATAIEQQDVQAIMKADQAIATSSDQLKQAETRQETANDKFKTAQKKHDDASSKVNKTQANLQAKTKDVSQKQTQLKQQQSTLKDLTTTHGKLEETLKQTHQQATDAINLSGKTQQSLQGAKGGLAGTERSHADVGTKLEEAKEQVGQGEQATQEAGDRAAATQIKVSEIKTAGAEVAAKTAEGSKPDLLSTKNQAALIKLMQDNGMHQHPKHEIPQIGRDSPLAKTPQLNFYSKEIKSEKDLKADDYSLKFTSDSIINSSTDPNSPSIDLMAKAIETLDMVKPVTITGKNPEMMKALASKLDGLEPPIEYKFETTSKHGAELETKRQAQQEKAPKAEATAAPTATPTQ